MLVQECEAAEVIELGRWLRLRMWDVDAGSGGGRRLANRYLPMELQGRVDGVLLLVDASVREGWHSLQPSNFSTRLSQPFHRCRLQSSATRLTSTIALTRMSCVLLSISFRRVA